MAQPEPVTAFNQEHAAEYDQRFAKLSPFRDALHLVTAAALKGLPENARILCAGAGTGAELLYLAARNPGWHFTAADPSGPMLEVCRRRTMEAGIAARCVFHEGYLDSLPAGGGAEDAGFFDAATSLLVSQFLLDLPARTAFFRQIASRLRPGGRLVSADLSSGSRPDTAASLMDLWMELIRETGQPEDRITALRAAYGRDVAVLPAPEIASILTAGGFETPALILQTGLIHAWSVRKPPATA